MACAYSPAALFGSYIESIIVFIVVSFTESSMSDCTLLKLISAPRSGIQEMPLIATFT